MIAADHTRVWHRVWMNFSLNLLSRYVSYSKTCFVTCSLEEKILFHFMLFKIVIKRNFSIASFIFSPYSFRRIVWKFVVCALCTVAESNLNEEFWRFCSHSQLWNSSKCNRTFEVVIIDVKNGSGYTAVPALIQKYSAHLSRAY